MKGFGYRREKELIAEAIKTHQLEQVQKQIAEIGAKLSAKQLGSLLLEAIERLPLDDIAWAYENLLPDETLKELRQQSANTIFEILMEKGFEPGWDFSSTEQNVTISRTASEALLAELPKDLRILFKELVNSGAIAIQNHSPIDQLEAQLGVPFIENLLQLIAVRVQILPDGQLANYLINICQGVQRRTNIPMMEIVSRRFRENPQFTRFVKKMERVQLEKNKDWLIDLIVAAGGKDEILPDPENPDNQIISYRGMELLDKVYRGKQSIGAFMEKQ